MRTTIAMLGLAATLLSGCAVAPCPPGQRSIAHDVVGYLNRNWPLHGQPNGLPNGCGCADATPHLACCEPAERVYSDDWDQPGCHPMAHAGAQHGGKEHLPPAVPLIEAPRGRFFPAPVRPVFSPQGPPSHSAAMGPTGRAPAAMGSVP